MHPENYSAEFVAVLNLVLKSGKLLKVEIIFFFSQGFTSRMTPQSLYYSRFPIVNSSDCDSRRLYLKYAQMDNTYTERTYIRKQTGFKRRLERSVRMNCLIVRVLFANLKGCHLERRIKLVSASVWMSWRNSRTMSP